MGPVLLPLALGAGPSASSLPWTDPVLYLLIATICSLIFSFNKYFLHDYPTFIGTPFPPL